MGVDHIPQNASPSILRSEPWGAMNECGLVNRYPLGTGDDMQAMEYMLRHYHARAYMMRNDGVSFNGTITLEYMIWIYNMIGMAVAIGDFYNAWKIMHRFAQCMEISKRLKNSVIHIYRKHNDGIAKWNRYDFLNLSQQYDTIIQKVISYKTE